MIDETPEVVAALDLGSNSFHMVVARLTNGQITLLDRLRETVRLASGLDAHQRLTPEAQTRALDCLRRFGERVKGMSSGSVRAVGTHTLRLARSTRGFLQEAERAFGHPIEIISGREEARLIFLGVSQTLADDGEQRLVVDIGGSSTELIIGRHFTPLMMESLDVGCVRLTQAHFGDGRLTEEVWRRANVQARLELRPVAEPFLRMGWQQAVGASGTLLAVARIIQAMGWAPEGITRDALYKLKSAMLQAGEIKKLELAGLSRERTEVFPGGVAILLALFERLNIRYMSVSEGALREGLLYDLLGRLRHEDIRERTIDALMRRFEVDTTHARHVEDTARNLFDQVAKDWGLAMHYADTLSWAARLHEIGLGIAHSRYHKHGAYVVENADLPGFSQQEQAQLALLVRAHRRKFPMPLFHDLPLQQQAVVFRLAILLRVAVLLHRKRSSEMPPVVKVRPGDASLELHFPKGVLKAHPLTHADLEQENIYLKRARFRLKLYENAA